MVAYDGLFNIWKKLYRNIASNFKKPEYVTDYKINCKNPRNFVNLDLMDLGPECNSNVKHLPRQTVFEIACGHEVANKVDVRWHFLMPSNS